jgi:hypothetical protein
MSASESSVVKQLKAVIEEDRKVIRTLREEIDRLRFLLGLHALRPAEADSARDRHPPELGNKQSFARGASN